jgi:adenylate cyclase, class 1
VLILHLQLLFDRAAEDIVFTVYCIDREYTTAEHDDSLYQHVAQYILLHRQQEDFYPIYITDIDLSKTLPGDEYAYVQTVY